MRFARVPSIRCVALLTLVGGLALALAEGCRGESLTAEDVAAAVQALGSDRAAERSAAERRLLEAGPALLGLLPEPDDLPDAAARDAVRRVRIELERAAAASAALPSRVTYVGRLTLSGMLAEIERQTGNRLQLDLSSGAVKSRSIEAVWRETPFWDAVTTLAQQADLEIALAESPRRVVLKRSDPVTDAASGLQRRPAIVAQGPVLVRIIDVQGPGARADRLGRVLRVRLEVLAEPRLWPLFLAVRDQDLTLTAGGESLRAFNPLSAREIEFTDAGAAAFDVVYNADASAALDKLALSGRLDLELVALSREFRWDGVPDRLPSVRRRGETTVSLDSVRTNADETAAEVQLTIRYGATGPAFESHRIGALLRSAALELPDGGRIASQPNPELTREQDGALGAKYRFEPVLTSWKDCVLTCDVPSAIDRTPIRFATGNRADALRPTTRPER